MKSLEVLLIEDEKSLARTLAQALRLESKGQIEIDIAGSSEQALPLLMHKNYDVVISDYYLPGEDGLSVIARLKKIAPKTQTILITGFGTDEIKQQAGEISGGYLTKPFEVLDLLLMVQKVMDQPAELGGQAFNRIDLEKRENRRILVMEEDNGLRRIYIKALRKADYLVDEAPTIQAARKLLSKQTYDIFICNLHMGRERGTDLLKELREKFDAIGTQIIMCSAYGKHSALTKEFGADYFLESPMSVGALLNLVSVLMETSKNPVAA